MNKINSCIKFEVLNNDEGFIFVCYQSKEELLGMLAEIIYKFRKIGISEIDIIRVIDLVFDYDIKE